MMATTAMCSTKGDDLIAACLLLFVTMIYNNITEQCQPVNLYSPYHKTDYVFALNIPAFLCVNRITHGLIIGTVGYSKLDTHLWELVRQSNLLWCESDTFRSVATIKMLTLTLFNVCLKTPTASRA